MIIALKTAEQRALEDTAVRMCAAARTAPKAKGTDMIVTAVVTGEDNDRWQKRCGACAAETRSTFLPGRRQRR